MKNLPIWLAMYMSLSGDMGDPLLRDKDLETVAAGDRYQRDVCRRALFCTISTETRLVRTTTFALQTTLSRASEPASLSSAL